MADPQASSVESRPVTDRTAHEAASRSSGEPGSGPLPTSGPVPPQPVAEGASTPAGPWPSRLPALGLLVSAAVLSLAAMIWAGLSAQRLDRLEQGAIQRLDGSDRRLIEAESSVKRFQDQVRDLQQRQALIDTRIAEAQSLYTQVEKLYRGLIQESADALLAEVESTLMLASQQLSLAVEPRGALIALEQIETRLARQNDATLAALRRALAADLERLRAYPATEIAALAMRLDQQIAQTDQWPLTASVARRERSGSADSGTAPGGASEQRAEGVAGAWSGIRQLADDLQRLIRVRRVDHPESLLIAPDQAYFIRENLRLMLLNTRLSLLSRNEALFRADLDRVIDSLSRYFDTENRSVAQALMQLRQLRGTRLTLEPPLPTESLAAVRAVRASRSARD